MSDGKALDQLFQIRNRMKQETACPKLCRSCKKRYYFFIFSGLSARDFSDSAQHRENRELSALRRFVSTG